MPWLQVFIQAPRDQAKALEDALLEAGALSVTLVDGADQPILEPGVGEHPLWDNVQVCGLFNDQVDTQSLDAALAPLYEQTGHPPQWQPLQDQAWERTWMDNFQPIQCGERLWICPSWQEPPAPHAVNLILDPGLAFGSGTHPTTFLCLQWLDQQDLRHKTVLDYGCGSGILGIAALLLGAEKVVAVDNDPQALIATKDNLDRNGLDPEHLVACLPQQMPEVAADITLANILAGPLIELAPRLTNATNDRGALCLSGITDGQQAAVIAAYEKNFRFEPIAFQEEWVRLSARKTL